MKKAQCRICRRAGTKLFLKGEKCLSAKCPIVRKPYSPGQKAKKRRRKLSEYGRQLATKQKLKSWYNLGERQFKKYVKEVLESREKVEDARTLFIKKLEMRLDNAVFRLGFATSRAQARQLVGHGHLLVNERLVDVPSYQLKKGDKISIKPNSLKKSPFRDLSKNLEKYQPPSWIKFNPKKLEAEIVGEPTFEEAAPPAEISAIFEFYSR